MQISAVDELLNELQDLPSIKPAIENETNVPSTTSPTQQPQTRWRSQSAVLNVDTLLADLQDCHTPEPSPKFDRCRSSSISAGGAGVGAGSPSRLRCSSIYLGGSGSRRGRSDLVQGNSICCDSLRCTACDFKVVWLPDVQWSNGVDYMFFRNSYPTKEKLTTKVQRCPGSCAYCCQCSWVSICTCTKLSSLATAAGADRALRWVCAGHAS